MLAGGKPLVPRVRQTLRAMPIAARVERDGASVAFRTAIEMAAEGRGPAARDRSEDPAVLPREPGAVLLDEALAVGANDVGHLEGWPRHRGRNRRDRRAVSGRDTGIASSGLATACRCRRDRCT